jgi:hypothetical protein
MELRIVIDIDGRKIEAVDVDYVLNRLDCDNDYTAGCVARGCGRVRSDYVEDYIYNGIVNNEELGVIVSDEELKGINTVGIEEL